MAFAKSPKTAAEKLGLLAGVSVRAVGAAFPVDLSLARVLRRGAADVVLVGLEQPVRAPSLIATGMRARTPTGRLWLCYRKGGAVSRAAIGAAMEATGLDLTWYRQVALDDDWSAIWVKRRSEFRVLNH